MGLFGSQSSSGNDDMTEMMESGGMDKQTMSKVERKGGDVAVILSAASVLLAWYEFYGRDNKAEGLFVGLWAPTILGFAGYLKQRAIEDRLEQTPFFGSDAGKMLRRLLG